MKSFSSSEKLNITVPFAPAGRAIIRVIGEGLGGMHNTVPSFKNIYRDERNRKICNLFNGANHKELAIMFDLTEGRIREIVNRRG